MQRIIITIIALFGIVLFLEWKKRGSRRMRQRIRRRQKFHRRMMEHAPVPIYPGRGDYHLDDYGNDPQWCSVVDDIGNCTLHGYRNCPQYRAEMPPGTVTAPQVQAPCPGKPGICTCPQHTVVKLPVPIHTCVAADDVGYCATHGWRKCGVHVVQAPPIYEQGDNHSVKSYQGKKTGGTYPTPFYNNEYTDDAMTELPI